MKDNDIIRRFFRGHAGAVVGTYPLQGEIAAEAENREDQIDWSVELLPDQWRPLPLPETPARVGEVPERFIDGCQTGQAVAWMRAPDSGWPIPIFLAEVGGIAMRLNGRELRRDFFGLDRVVSFVCDPFPWPEVEALAGALGNLADFPLRFLPTKVQLDDPIEGFDYEKMRSAADIRAGYERDNWESLALAADYKTPALCDGPLQQRVRSSAIADRFQLVVGVIKTHSANLLHPQGWRTLFDLKPGQRTPFFHKSKTMPGGREQLPVVTWYLKMAHGQEDMPNWGIVRVEVPWVQFQRHPENQRPAYVHRLSRWLIDARCRQRSYARMPVSLEPIVRAEDSLKSLFTPFGVLRNRFLRYAGVVGSSSV